MMIELSFCLLHGRKYNTFFSKKKISEIFSAHRLKIPEHRQLSTTLRFVANFGFADGTLQSDRVVKSNFARFHHYLRGANEPLVLHST